MYWDSPCWDFSKHRKPQPSCSRRGKGGRKQSERIGELEREKKGKQFPSPVFGLASGLLSSHFSCYTCFFNLDRPGSPLQVSNVVWIPQWSKPLDQIAKSKYCHSLINIKGSAVNFLVLKMTWPRKVLARFHFLLCFIETVGLTLYPRTHYVRHNDLKFVAIPLP